MNRKLTRAGFIAVSAGLGLEAANIARGKRRPRPGTTSTASTGTTGTTTTPMTLPTGLPTLLGASSGPEIFCDYLNGNDTTGTGSLANPYKTLDKCKNVVDLAGGIINLRNNGTPHQPLSGERVLIQRSATSPATNPVTVRTYPTDGGKALFKGEITIGNTSSGGAPYRGWRFQNLEIIKLTAHELASGAYGFRLASVRDIEISQCDIHDNNQGCILCTASDTALTDNIQIFRNKIHDTGSSGTHNANGSHDHGIYIAGASTFVDQNIYIWNNLIYNCNWGFAIQLFAPQIDTTLIAYNTLYNTDPANNALTGGGHVVYIQNDGGTGIVGVLVTSNLVARGRQGAGSSNNGVNALGTGSGNNVRNNMTYQIVGTDYPSWSGWTNNATRVADNLAEQDPLWTDAVNGDFRIASGSPAIGAGETGFMPADDYYGNPRTTADIGAVAAPVSALGWHGRGVIS